MSRFRLFALAVALLAPPLLTAAGPRKPLIGSQIWFEPGESDSEEALDHIFKTLADHQMPVARVGMIWNYMERSPGQWDFTMYDRVFRSAEKHRVKIVATLWPQAKTQFLTGIPDTEEHLLEGERYLKAVVGRYRKSPALDTWLLMNEPGQLPRANSLAVRRFRVWLQKKYGTIEKLNQVWLSESMVPDGPPYKSFEHIDYDPRWALAYNWPIPNIDWHVFWREHLTWYMNWVAEQVRNVDPLHALHVNPQPLLGNLASRSFDLPAWRPFLSTLGVSAYPAANFSFLQPEQHALGFSYLVDLLSGAIEPKPVWVTEIPGGNQIYGQTRAACPTPQDIAQWLWTSIGAGAERCIFWLLNPRRKAREVGEYGLLDFQGRPSERLQTASAVAAVVNANAELFENAKTVESPAIIFLSLESMTLQEHYKSSSAPGRDRDAHIMCALGYYQALNELGIPARIKHVHDFDWRAGARQPLLAILPHVTALSERQAADISAFVRNGNTLLISGLSGFYDPEGKFLPMKKYPFEDLVGATVKETRALDRDCQIELLAPRLTLPSHLWVSEIENRVAEVIGRHRGWVTAVRRKVGKGEVIWVASPVGLGAWLNDRKPLATWLAEVTRPFLGRLPIRFDGYQAGCLMRAMRSGDSVVTVVTNGGSGPNACRLAAPAAGLTPHVLWGEPSWLSADSRQVSLGPKGTLVAVWK